jgi:hypothetical protein
VTTFDPGFTHQARDGKADGVSGPQDTDSVRDTPLSSLDELQMALAQSDAVAEQEFADHVLYGPGKVIRLTCSTELDQADLKADQLAAIPRTYRRKRIPDATKMDEAEAFARVIGRQTLEIAILKGDGYRPLDGTFEDANVLAAFGAAEAHVAVRRIFVKDVYLMRAGEEFVDACGYGETRPGETDPT